MEQKLKYWLPFESGSGEIWVEGPYDTYERAKAARKKAKLDIGPQAKCGAPLVAATKEEAEKRARSFV